jgi:hypothetical protein
MRSTHSADSVLGRPLHHLFPELARRAVAQRLVRMHAIVILEPRIELTQHAGAIGPVAHPGIIALNGFDEGFGYAVRLRAFDARPQPRNAARHKDSRR